MNGAGPEITPAYRSQVCFRRFRAEARKCVEDSRRLVFWNTDARVVYVDPDLRSLASGANQNAPSRLGLFDGVGYKVAENAAPGQTGRPGDPIGNDASV
jgi:hypothetical protein